MAYSTGPYADFSSLPAPPRPIIHSARQLDFANRVLVLDAITGGNVGMRPMAQRVMILAADAFKEQTFNTPRGRNAIRQNIINALAPMTAWPQPDIALLSVEVATPHYGGQFTEVRFRDLTSGTVESVQLV